MAALLLSGTAAAQSPGAPRAGTVEVGAFGQWTWFDGNAGRVNAVPEDGLGYGGRLGIFVSPRFQLEADGYYSPQDRSLTEAFCCAGTQPTEVHASAFALRLNYNQPIGAPLGRPSQFILGAGAVRTNYAYEGGLDESDTSGYGASGLAGLRIGILPRTSLRFDGVIDYMPRYELSSNMNLHARAGVSFLLGGVTPALALISPAPLPTPTPPMLPPVAPAPPVEQAIRVCVVQGTMLAEVDAIYLPGQGDTLVAIAGERRPFASVYSSAAPAYASSENWYIRSVPMTFAGRKYVKFGLPRVLDAAQLTRVGDFSGVGVFAETGAEAPQEVLYVPLRPGCEFQPYQQQATIQVRG
jgi:hypothetical protein